MAICGFTSRSFRGCMCPFLSFVVFFSDATSPAFSFFACQLPTPATAAPPQIHIHRFCLIEEERYSTVSKSKIWFLHAVHANLYLYYEKASLYRKGWLPVLLCTFYTYIYISMYLYLSSYLFIYVKKKKSVWCRLLV